MAHKIGDGFFTVDTQNDDATRMEALARYKQALVLFENAVKLCVRAGDSTGLQGLKGEIALMFERAEKTLRDDAG